jgi:hypothetical protein
MKAVKGQVMEDSISHLLEQYAEIMLRLAMLEEKQSKSLLSKIFNR